METVEEVKAKRAAAWCEGQNRALELIARGAPLEDVLNYLVMFIEEQGHDLICSVLLLQDGRLHHGAAPSLPDEYVAAIDGIAIGPTVGSCGAAAFLGRPVASFDHATDPNWALVRDLALRHGLRASWSTPIFAGSGEVLGTFAVYYGRPSPPQPDHLHLVEVATHLAGIAILHHRAEEALKLRTRELLERDQRKDEFLAMLAHELRNPLTPIVTALSLMQAQRDDPEASERYRQLIERQVKHLGRLVDDLLDVSRITHGQITLAVSRTTAAELVAQAIEAARPILDARRHQLSIDLPEAEVELDVDPVRMAQVLSNLLINAAKFTEPGGHIAVRVAVVPGGVEIAVKDDGAGIARDMLSRIFEPFMQANPSIDRAQGGLGIGLTLARRLVEMHGGHLAAHSEGLGQGAELVVYLPMSSRHERESARRDVEHHEMPFPPAHSERSPRRVLVVDDNADVAEVLSTALQNAGNAVHVARDGPEAITEAAAWLPDAVLLDIGLPGLDGYEVARRLRVVHGGAMRIVALSGYGRPADRAKSAEVGINEHLVKPADLDTILAAVGGDSSLPPQPRAAA